MGANLIADGATFRCWAPHAESVHVVGDFNNRVCNEVEFTHARLARPLAGFIPGVKDRQRYMFYVVGEGGEGLKRDPYARELESPFPSECIIRHTDFPWHESGYVTPPFSRVRHLSAPRRDVLHAESAAQGRHVSRCGCASCRISPSLA